MASLLLMGDPDVVSVFASNIVDGHDLCCWFPDVEPALPRPVTSLETLDEIPDNLDGVAVLTVRDDGEQESCLSMLYETGSPDGVPLFVNTLHTTATEISAMIADRSPVIGVACIPGLTNYANMVEAAPAMQVPGDVGDAACRLFESLIPGRVERVEDRVGLVSPRILAMIINEAAFALMEGVAGAEDIDTAMRLGTNYPLGPLKWADSIGVEVVTELLQALFDEYGEERYRPCVLLKQYARAGRTFFPA